MRYILLFISGLLLISCSGRDIPGDIITSEFERITTILPQASWSVLYFEQNGTDKTSDFEVYEFTFYNDGRIEAESEFFAKSGTWEYSSRPGANERLILDFEQDSDFYLLKNSWQIEAVTGFEIKLFFSETDRLIFQKK